ncbi:hypothetical protein AAHB94_01325 [Bacillus toyonensis]
MTDNKADFSEDKDRAPFKMHPDLLNMAQKHGIEIRYSLELSKTIDEIIEVVTDKEYLDECKKNMKMNVKNIIKVVMLILKMYVITVVKPYKK